MTKSKSNLNAALMEASRNGNIELVKFFLEKGANVNAKDNDSDTALMKASCSYPGHKEIVFLLLDMGANANAKDNLGWTALMKATYMGFTEIVTLIKNHIIKQKKMVYLVINKGRTKGENSNLLISHGQNDIFNRVVSYII